MKFSESVELLYRSYSVNRRLRSSHVNVTMTNARRFLGLMKDLGAWLSESLLIFSIVVCRFRATIQHRNTASAYNGLGKGDLCQTTPLRYTTPNRPIIRNKGEELERQRFEAQRRSDRIARR